jgi:hypothetical protein
MFWAKAWIMSGSAMGDINVENRPIFTGLTSKVGRIILRLNLEAAGASIATDAT